MITNALYVGQLHFLTHLTHNLLNIYYNKNCFEQKLVYIFAYDASEYSKLVGFNLDSNQGTDP